MKPHESHFKNTGFSRLLSFVLFLLIVANSYSQNEDVGVFQFEEEVIDYGTINQNDDGMRTFTFTNRGRAPIVISKVKTTCGCTVPSYPKHAILPGETAAIEITYATNRLGTFSKSITVFSNASETQKTLRIKGNVLAKPNKL